MSDNVCSAKVTGCFGFLVLIVALSAGCAHTSFFPFTSDLDTSCNQSGEYMWYSDCHTERAIVNDRFIGSDTWTYVSLTNEKFIDAYVKTADPVASHAIKINSTCDFRLGTYSGRYQTILSITNCTGGA